MDMEHEIKGATLAQPIAPQTEAEPMTTDQAREFLIGFMNEHFTDRTFHRYIRGTGGVLLAGDFAWQMATALRRIGAAPCAMCNGAGSVGHAPDGYFDCPECTPPVAQPIADVSAPADWLIVDSLLYRLNEFGVNCDEISVTMAEGSRKEAPRTERAKQLLAMLSARAAAPVSGGMLRLGDGIKLTGQPDGSIAVEHSDAPVSGLTCKACNGAGTWIGQHDGYDDADCAVCDGSGKAAPVSGPTEAPNFERMFMAACEDLAAISDMLGIDSDIEGGAAPIIEAIESLRTAAPMPSRFDLEAIDRAMQHMGDALNMNDFADESGEHITTPGFKAIERLLEAAPVSGPTDA